MSEQLTPKQIAARKYHAEHREEILARKRRIYEQTRPEDRPRRIGKPRIPGHKCFLCGHEVIKDGDKWSCLNPSCEADFVEVL